VSFGVERTPVSTATLLYGLAKRTIRGGDISDEAAKALMGLSIATAVGAAVKEGWITGGGPTDPGTRDLLFASGWRPYSFKIPETVPGVGGQYLHYGRLEPLGVSIGMVADFIDLFDLEEPEELPPAIGAAFQRNLTSKTWVSGITGVLNAVEDFDRHGQAYTLRSIGSLVPNVAAQLSRAMDPVLRDPETLGEALASRTPTQSTTIPPRLDVRGDPIQRPGTAVERFISPIQRSPVVHDPVAETLLHLGIPLTAPSERITLPEGVVLSRQDRQVLQQARGKEVYGRLRRIVDRPGFQDAPEAQQTRVLERAKRAASSFVADRARRRLRRGIPLRLEELTKFAQRTEPPRRPGVFGDLDNIRRFIDDLPGPPPGPP
jgi:hypothetical protein